MITPNDEIPPCFESPVSTVKRVLLVDDHPVFRQGLRLIIDRGAGMKVCEETGSASQALAILTKVQPELAIIDVTLRNGDGIELTRTIHRTAPAVKVLVVSQHEEEIYAPEALRAGARGYLTKHEAPEKLLLALETIAQNKLFLSERGKRLFLGDCGAHGRSAPVAWRTEKLSEREQEVFGLIGRGYSSREIGTQLNLSIKTVDTYREHLKEKLALCSGAALVRLAFQAAKFATRSAAMDRPSLDGHS
jgi:DNA-binding NarL/FixJ family response regulator